jgi:hypothetical protein
MDAPSRTSGVPVRTLLVRAVRESRVDLDRNAYRLAVFEIYTETLVDDAHVFYAVSRIEIRRLLQMCLSTSLHVPISFE